MTSRASGDAHFTAAGFTRCTVPADRDLGRQYEFLLHPLDRLSSVVGLSEGGRRGNRNSRNGAT